MVLAPLASSSVSNASGPRAPGGGALAAPALKRARAPVQPPAGLTVSVSVDPEEPIGPVVPGDFLGLSFEGASLPPIAAYANTGDLVNLLRSLGPGIMRFGGISSDRNTAWLQEGIAPAWAQTTIVPRDLAGVASVAAATGWRVLLTVNLGHYEPAAAAREAHVAQALLGRRLAGIAIGNEPDRYVADGLRPAGWSLADYLTEAAAYRAAIAAAAPGVPIVGPDSSTGGTSLSWVTATASAERPALLTDHYYPLSSCGSYKPKLGELLSPVTRANETAMLRRLAAIASASALPLRLDESNDISCRGEPGVSNAFVSALWAVDYVARAMASGLSGINFHDLIAEPSAYSPLAAGDAQQLASGALHAEPEWYALLLARRLLGDRPVQAQLTASDPDLTAGAFLSPSGDLHIALVNFASPEAQRLLVRLRVAPSFGAGTVLRLTAPGPGATSGITLGGRGVSPTGTWSPSAALPRVSGEPGSLELYMPPGSAALVTLQPTG